MMIGAFVIQYNTINLSAAVITDIDIDFLRPI